MGVNSFVCVFMCVSVWCLGFDLGGLAMCMCLSTTTKSMQSYPDVIVAVNSKQVANAVDLQSAVDAYVKRCCNLLYTCLLDPHSPSLWYTGCRWVIPWMSRCGAMQACPTSKRCCSTSSWRRLGGCSCSCNCKWYTQFCWCSRAQ